MRSIRKPGTERKKDVFNWRLCDIVEVRKEGACRGYTSLHPLVIWRLQWALKMGVLVLGRAGEPLQCLC